MAEPEPVVGLLEEVWASIVEVCGDLTPDEWARSTRCPGWTVQDQVSHLLGGERMLMGEDPPDIDVTGADNVRNPIGEVNERWASTTGRRRVPRCSRSSGPSPPNDWRSSGPCPRRSGRGGLHPEGEGPYRRSWPSVRSMRGCTSRTSAGARATGQLEGLVVEAAPRPAGPGHGLCHRQEGGGAGWSTVVFEITGDAGRTMPVVVDGRAQVVGDPPDPTVTITVDIETYVALCGGREDPAAALRPSAALTSPAPGPGSRR